VLVNGYSYLYSFQDLGLCLCLFVFWVGIGEDLRYVRFGLGLCLYVRCSRF
jgi:hypothetical protein